MTKYLIFSLMTAVALLNIHTPHIDLQSCFMPLNIEMLSSSSLDIQVIGTSISTNVQSAAIVGFIPYHRTYSLSKGIVGLNRMYNSLESSDPLKTFLDKHCNRLLSPLHGVTSIPVGFSHIPVLNEQPNTIKLEPNFNPRQFDNLEGKVGVYVFYLPGAEQVTQCGSTVRFTNRILNHYRDAAKGEFIFKVNSIQDYNWTPVALGIDYVELFNSNHVMTPEQEAILTAFTEQEVRSLEQAYTTYAKPTNYKNIHIFTSHNNWKIGDTHRQTDAKRITWVTEDGTTYTRASISAGLYELGFSFAYIKKVARSDSPYVNTLKYGLVKLTIDNLSSSDTAADVRYGTPLNTKVDKTNLVEDLYYLYSTDMVQLPYGPYKTVAETNLAMGLASNYSGTFLWADYLHTVSATKLGIEVYIVKGVSTTKIPVLAQSLSTGETVEYKSITSALKVVSPKNRGGYSVLKAMVTGKPITTLEHGSYLLTFKYPEHLAVSIRKYNLHKRTNPGDKISILPFPGIN